MPIDKYYGGHGKDVMRAMVKRYGGIDAGKRVFYATANKRGLGPGKKKPRKRNA